MRAALLVGLALLAIVVLAPVAPVASAAPCYYDEETGQARCQCDPVIRLPPPLRQPQCM
jgi:hypothetical protein